MSAGNSFTSLAAPEHHEDAGSQAHHAPLDSSPPADLALAPADLANLLANGQWGSGAEDAGAAHAPALDAGGYDGHVALALDTGSLPDMDATLDMLTSSHQLIDVPALDVSATADDASSV
jgi:hypothetical protein